MATDGIAMMLIYIQGMFLQEAPGFLPSRSILLQPCAQLTILGGCPIIYENALARNVSYRVLCCGYFLTFPQDSSFCFRSIKYSCFQESLWAAEGECLSSWRRRQKVKRARMTWILTPVWVANLSFQMSLDLSAWCPTWQSLGAFQMTVGDIWKLLDQSHVMFQ